MKPKVAYAFTSSSLSMINIDSVQIIIANVNYPLFAYPPVTCSHLGGKVAVTKAIDHFPFLVIFENTYIYKYI